MDIAQSRVTVQAKGTEPRDIGEGALASRIYTPMIIHNAVDEQSLVLERSCCRIEDLPEAFTVQIAPAVLRTKYNRNVSNAAFWLITPPSS
jgi:hypothetical protein